MDHEMKTGILQCLRSREIGNPELHQSVLRQLSLLLDLLRHRTSPDSLGMHIDVM